MGKEEVGKALMKLHNEEQVPASNILLVNDPIIGVVVENHYEEVDEFRKEPAPETLSENEVNNDMSAESANSSERGRPNKKSEENKSFKTRSISRMKEASVKMRSFTSAKIKTFLSPKK